MIWNWLCVILTSATVRKLAFSASLLTFGEGNSNAGQLIYRHVITNIGNHYNVITGSLFVLFKLTSVAWHRLILSVFCTLCVSGDFTAPVRGAYYFRFTGHVAHSNLSMRLGIFKNGQLIVTSGDRHTTSTDLEDNASNGVVVLLEVGDVVTVQLDGTVWDDQYHRTTFSGFLLFSL